MAETKTDSWTRAYSEINRKIEADPQFVSLVKAWATMGRRHSASRRCRTLANLICGRLGLDPAIFRGNAFGAAQKAIDTRRLP
jgi:hypothetical protein